MFVSHALQCTVTAAPDFFPKLKMSDDQVPSPATPFEQASAALAEAPALPALIIIDLALLTVPLKT